MLNYNVTIDWSPTVYIAPLPDNPDFKVNIDTAIKVLQDLRSRSVYAFEDKWETWLRNEDVIRYVQPVGFYTPQTGEMWHNSTRLIDKLKSIKETALATAKRR